MARGWIFMLVLGLPFELSEENYVFVMVVTKQASIFLKSSDLQNGGGPNLMKKVEICHFGVGLSQHHHHVCLCFRTGKKKRNQGLI